MLADRYGEKQVIVSALVATALGSLFVTIAPIFVLFALAAVSLGAGAGRYFSVGSTLLSKRFEEGQSLTLSVHSTGGPLAGLVLPIAATTVAPQFNWRAGIALSVGVSVFALIGVFIIVDDTPAPDPTLRLREAFHPKYPLRIPSRRHIFFIIIAIFGMYDFQSIISFFKLSLKSNTTTVRQQRVYYLVCYLF